MSYTAKTNWKNGDKLPASDLNRIEQGVLDAHTIAKSKQDATQVQQAIENATASKIDALQAQSLIDNATQGLINEQQAQTLIDASIDDLSQQLDSAKTDIEDNTQRIQTLEDAPKIDEKVKMTADGAAEYLQALLDGVTIVNNNGKLTVENLNGLLVTKEDLNQLAGVKANIQGQIDALSSVGEFKGTKDTKADLDVVTDPLNSDMYIVLRDETHDNVTTMYMYNGTWAYLGEFSVKIRDFTTQPLDLATEATGVLPLAHIPTGTTQGTVATGDHTHAEATTSTAGFISTADKTKLDGVAAGATANATDAQLRDRSTHTGTQPFTTISGTAAPEQIPNLDASKIATGTMDAARLPTDVTATEQANGFMSADDKARLDAMQGIKPLTVDLFPTTNPELAAFQEYLMKNLQLAGIFDYNPSEMLDDSFSLWYDPNDLSTLFQDQHGEIPVTEIGQPVGLWLDKSRGLTEQVVFDLSERTIDDAFDPANAGSTITDSTVTITSAGGVIGWFDELGGKIGKIRAKGNASKPVRIRNGSTAQGAYIIAAGDFDIDIYTGAMFAYRDSGLYFSAETTVSAADPCVLRFDELIVTAIDSVPSIQATEIAKPKLGYNAVTKSNFLKFDGVRSCMNVGRVDLSNTQQVTIMHAARKMSPSTAAMIFELTAKATAEGALTYGVNTATGVGASNETTWFMSLSDTTQGEMIGSAVGYPSPDARVSIMQWDKSKTTQVEQMRLWLDNQEQTLIFNDDTKIGSGNFAKLEAYFGTRGQYGNQFMFNGEFYEFILMGRLATEDEITSTYSRLRKQITV